MLKLDHIGYAVRDMEKFLEEFFIPLFRPAEVTAAVEDPAQKVRVAFATLPGGARIELIQPLEESSPVTRILQARQGGLYHLCYRVENLEEELARFREKKCIVLSQPAPAPAFEGRRIAFLYTPFSDLIELVEEGAPPPGAIHA